MRVNLIGDPYAGIPPGTKRQLKIASIAFVVVAVGAPILSMFVELWIVVLIVAAIAAAIFIPMGFVLSREKRELTAGAEDLHPDTEH